MKTFANKRLRKPNGQSRMDNQEWTIQRNWQQWIHKTQDEDKQNKKHNTENKSHVSIQMYDSNITQKTSHI